ncbi:MAG TPA: tetratricopeptide repeat protein [Verrucomicrobiae bacterium]|nr:tetratricopeptide repeat protein [Verrucomicrobiae bacterium]
MNLRISVALFVLVTATFLSAVRGGFVGLDDPEYVTGNDHVQAGLTWQNVAWAFHSTAASNWHPLTWISHMTDVQLFGLAPWGHHLVSILLHAFNAALLFIVLRRMTGDVWASFVVAAFFGVHPLRVESVAWISERKDVLGAAFWMLTLWAYSRYAQRKPGVESREWIATPDSRPLGFTPATYGFYFLALVFFLLGLLAKPMLVTLPFVLLLLDYWPLRRWHRPGILLLEKAPFFLAAAIASYVTFVVQQQAGSVSAAIPFSDRAANALVSYWRYLGKLFFPKDLAAYYPFPSHWPWVLTAMAAAALIGVSVLAIWHRRKHPYLLVGWAWFLGVLVPVIGLVKAGEQAMADRYTYLPSVGILICFIWGVRDLLAGWRYRFIFSAMIVSVALVACIGLTQHQIGFWKDSETLFRHAIAVTKSNYLAYDNLGTALSAKGLTDQSIKAYEEALRIRPDFAEAHNNLGASLERKHLLKEAIDHFVQAIRLNPRLAGAHYNLASALAEAGRVDMAIAEYQTAIRIKPDYIDAHYNLANLLNSAGKFDEAASECRQVLKLNPRWVEANYNLGVAYCGAGRLESGAAEFEKFLKLQPNSAYAPDAQMALGAIAEKQGHTEEARSRFSQAIRLKPDSARAHAGLGSALQKLGRLEDAAVEFREALRLSPSDSETRRKLEEVLSGEK